MKTILMLLAVVNFSWLNDADSNSPFNVCTTGKNTERYACFINGQSSREQLTIRWLAKTLNRMGETKLAKRLMEDYYTHKSVRFGSIKDEYGRVMDANAASGRGANGKNEIIFNESMLSRTGDQDRLLTKKPYGASSSLISDAMTVVHEYVHMDQQDPDNKPAWEDPAWQTSDRTLNNWVKKIEAEYNAARNMPASKEKTAKLTELADILKKLNAELAVTREAIHNNIANESLSPNQKWLLDDTEKRIQLMKEAFKKYEDIAKLGPQQPPQKKDPGYWELVSEQAFDKLAASDINYSLTAGSGSISARWSQNNDVFKVTATFTPPPKQIRPGDRFPIQLSVAVSNQGDQYSASGEFAVFFDRPEIEPGSVIAPVSLKGDKGESSYIQFTHKQGVLPSPSASMQVYIDAKTLPTGSKGARIALLASLYNGRSAGYRYIYEWKENW